MKGNVGLKLKKKSSNGYWYLEAILEENKPIFLKKKTDLIYKGKWKALVKDGLEVMRLEKC